AVRDPDSDPLGERHSGWWPAHAIDCAIASTVIRASDAGCGLCACNTGHQIGPVVCSWVPTLRQLGRGGYYIKDVSILLCVRRSHFITSPASNEPLAFLGPF